MFSSNFVSGQPSSGIVTIPVVVTGFGGTISGTITATNFSGTLQTTNVTLATTQLSFLVNYDGGGVASQRNLTVNIAGAANTVACVVAVQVTTLSTCSAPLSLSVTRGISGNTISFAPATSAPASYQVLRRYFGSVDAPGSYTTIGTPTYNSGTGLFSILDATAPVDNNVYIYKAVSLCADGSRPFAFTYFANMTCPNDVAYTITNSSIAFSFTNSSVGGDVNRYEVSLWNISQTVQIGSTQTFTTVFPSPMTGSFTGLTTNTQYVVKIVQRILVSPVDFTKICSNVVETTTVMVNGTAEVKSCIGTGRILDVKSDGVSLAPLSGVMPIISASLRTFSVPSGIHTISGIVDGSWYVLRAIGSNGVRQQIFNPPGGSSFSFAAVTTNSVTPWKVEMDCKGLLDARFTAETCSPSNVFAITAATIDGDTETHTTGNGSTWNFTSEFTQNNGTVSVTFTGAPGSIEITDTNGTVTCRDYDLGVQTEVFTGIVFEGTASPLIIKLKCAICYA